MRPPAGGWRTRSRRRGPPCREGRGVPPGRFGVGGRTDERPAGRVMKQPPDGPGSHPAVNCRRACRLLCLVSVGPARVTRPATDDRSLLSSHRIGLARARACPRDSRRGKHPTGSAGAVTIAPATCRAWALRKYSPPRAASSTSAPPPRSGLRGSQRSGAARAHSLEGDRLPASCGLVCRAFAAAQGAVRRLQVGPLRSGTSSAVKTPRADISTTSSPRSRSNSWTSSE